MQEIKKNHLTNFWSQKCFIKCVLLDFFRLRIKSMIHAISKEQSIKIVEDTKIPGSIKDRIHRIWAPEIFDPKT